MLSNKVCISAPTGLHARPASELVKLVKSFADSRISLSTDAKTVNAASMISLLSLGLKDGTEVVVSADGGNEAAALEAVCNFITSITE